LLSFQSLTCHRSLFLPPSDACDNSEKRGRLLHGCLLVAKEEEEEKEKEEEEEEKEEE
jgi:hypothetical protein